MTDPLVSVLVPAYGAEAFIADCLRSVMAQGYPELELIVVDDCSPDATYELALDTVGDWPQATVIRNPVNVGNRESFRRLLGMANGPLVKFLCNDDLLAPDAIARLVDAVQTNTSAVMATSSRQPIDEAGAPLALDRFPQPGYASDVVVDGLTAGDRMLRSQANWIGEPTTVLFRRECLPAFDPYRLGSFRPERNLDVVWWLQILRHGSLAVLAEPLSSFRIHSGQVTQQVGRGPLVLAWHEILLGAREIGFLSNPSDELAAWLAFVNLLNNNADSFGASDTERAGRVIGEVAVRLGELCPA